MVLKKFWSFRTFSEINCLLSSHFGKHQIVWQIILYYKSIKRSNILNFKSQYYIYIYIYTDKAESNAIILGLIPEQHLGSRLIPSRLADSSLERKSVSSLHPNEVHISQQHNQHFCSVFKGREESPLLDSLQHIL